MPQPAAEWQVTTSDVDRLLQAQHPHLRAPLRAVASGWDNDVFRLGEDLAVRLPRREAAVRLVMHEQRWLPELAARLPVPVPAPVAIGVPSDAYPRPWSVVPWFTGERVLDLPVLQRDELAVEVAGVLRALHVEAPTDAPRNPVRGVPLRSRDDAVRARLVASPELTPVWDAALAAQAWHRPDVWVHGDVHPGNLLAAEGRLTAVLDFGDMCAGDPACDLAIAWIGFGPSGRRAFAAALGPDYDTALWSRAKGWAVSIATVLRDADDPAFRAMSEHASAQLLLD